MLHHLERQFTGEQRNGGMVIQRVLSLFSKASELRNECVHISGDPGEAAQFGFSAFPGGCVSECVHELLSQTGPVNFIELITSSIKLIKDFVGTLLYPIINVWSFDEAE